MVKAILLPRQPEHYEEALLREGLFDALAYSVEDRRRGELYRQRAVAEEFRTSSGSMEEFYRDLAMEATFAEVDINSMARTAQLTQKTNQFNTTTVRYTEAEVAQRMGDPDWYLLTVQVRDRFGDNGIVGVAMGRTKGKVLDIDTFLLSCRVIGRTIETAMLERMCEEAKSRSLQYVTGRIIPTAKNVPVRDLFERHGFVLVNEGPAGETTWRMDLEGDIPSYPSWLKIVGTKIKD
jgi:FkbH-like protein